MITFYEVPSMLNPNYIFLQYRIEGETQQRNKKIKYSELTTQKNHIVQFELMRISRDLLNQRKNVFQHVGFSNEAQIRAINKLERKLLIGYFPSMQEFFRYILKDIIPSLEILRPHEKSRFKNYGLTLDKMKDFSEKCLNFYENSENSQSADNQRINKFKDVNRQKTVTG